MCLLVCWFDCLIVCTCLCVWLFDCFIVCWFHCLIVWLFDCWIVWLLDYLFVCCFVCVLVCFPGRMVFRECSLWTRHQNHLPRRLWVVLKHSVMSFHLWKFYKAPSCSWDLGFRVWGDPNPNPRELGLSWVQLVNPPSESLGTPAVGCFKAFRDATSSVKVLQSSFM